MGPNKDYGYGDITPIMFEGYARLQIMKSADGNADNGRLIEVNPAFEALFDIPREEAAGKTLRELLPDIWAELFPIPPAMTRTGEPVQLECHLKASGQQVLVRPCPLSHGQMVLLFLDVTLQKKAKDTFQLHKLLFENAQDIILYITFEGRIVNANKRGCETYGYTKQQLLSMTIQDLRHPSTAEEYEHQMQMADADGVVFEAIHMRSDGSSFPVEVSAKTTSINSRNFRVHIIRDITIRRENEERITWLAQHDSLTEISNRASFITHLEQEIQRSIRHKTPFAVMLFDVDKFKYINDHYGHQAGDLVLRHVAQAARRVLRAGDQIGRFGGDEFVVLQTGIQCCTDVETLAERIQASVGAAVFYQSMQIRIKISIGISLFPEDAMDASSLLHCADQAMYRVKQAGGGAFAFFAPCNPLCIKDRLCFEQQEDPGRRE